MSKDFELGKRIAWLRRNRGLEQKEAARETGINYYTYQPYEYGNNPGRKNLDKIVAFYKCNKAWLLTGEGEPYPAIGEGFQEVNEAGAAYAPLFRQGRRGLEIRISEALQMAARILESKTPYAMALNLTIQHFDRAIAAEARIGHAGNNHKTLEERFNDFLREFDYLQKENQALHAEVERLKTICKGREKEESGGDK